MSLDSRLQAGFTRVGQEIKAVRAAVAAVTSGATIDGGNFSTNHSGNLRVDFGSFT